MKIRRKLRSIFSILLCVFMIVPNCTVAFAYDDPAIIDEYNSETPSNDPSIIVEANVNDESSEVVSEEVSEITSEEENSEITSEEENSEITSEEENSEPESETETSEKETSKEVTSEELNSEETSEEDIDKEDTKKSNIEVVFDEGVTVIIKNEDNTVKITRDDENIYVFDKDNNNSVGPYDDKYVINDFDVDEDIDVSFIANDNYVLTNYSISNDEETIVEESEVEELNYNTQLTTTENIYININTGIAEGTVDVSTLDDTQKYIYENVNSEYINKVTYFLPADMILLKSTVADKHKLSSESFEGLFTSNEDQIAEAFLYQTDDAIGLYDINRKSDYLVGIADTLKDDDDFSIIDYTFAKSNTDAELLDGAFFDTETGLFYVPKSLIDYLEDGSINIGSKQLQILYAFDDGTDNVEVKEIEDEEGEVEEITVNTAAPKVFMRMAAPRLLGAAPDMGIPYGGMITGNIVEGDTIQIPMNYLYVTGNNAYINNTNVLADPSGSISFFASLLNGTTNISSLRANLSACFPHRLVVENPTNYTFNSGAVMTVYPGIYALECIHTKQQYGPNHAPKSPNTITARILSVNISGDSGYVYVGLTSPETYTQSGAGVIKLQYQNTTTVEEKFAGFRIQKKDNHGNTLSEGFKFVVYNESNRYLGIITTGSDGTAKMDNIKLPTNADSLKVRVQEISAPVGYAIDPHVYETYATEGGENTVSLTFIDTLLPKVTVRKVDTDGNWLQRYAYCQILDTNGNVVVGAFACGYSDVTIYLPEVGDYVLHEYKVPDGYLKAEDIPFTITEENTITALELTMSDPYIKVEIDKFKENADGEVEGFLPGAHLYLYRKVADGYYESVKNWISGETGYIIKALPAGEYKLEEHEAPEGYVRSKPLEFEVKSTVDLQKFEMYDPPTKLSILKVDELGNPLEGATLALYYTTSTTDNNGKVTYNQGDFIERWVSDGTPHVLYELPTDQTYWLEEDEAPPGYTNFGHQLIQLGHQHTDECYANETTPWPLVYATYSASRSGNTDFWVCAACGNCLLDQWHYTWYENWQDPATGIWYYNIEHNETVNDSDHRNEVMRFGQIGNYYTNEDWTEFRTSQDADHPIKVRDAFPSNNIKVFKDSSLKQADGTYKTAGINGVSSNKDPNYPCLEWWQAGTSGTAGGWSGYRFETNPNIDYGEINIDDGHRPHSVGAGQYSLRGFHMGCTGTGKTGAKASFNPADHYSSNGGELICGFAETTDLDNYVISVYDTKNDTYGFKVAKTDLNGTLLSGATLSVYKVDGDDETLIRTFVSKNTYELFFDVEPGTYKLVEVKPPTGYKLAAPKTFTIDSDNKLATITIEDTPTVVKVSKKRVNGTNIEDAFGADLEIIDPEGVVVDHWTSDNTSHILTGKLSINTTYTLREIEEIPGTVNAGDFKFSIDEEGNIIQQSSSDYYEVSSDKKSIICYNKLNSVKFIKQDEDGNLLDGAILQLVNKTTGAVVDTWVSGEDKNSSGESIPHEIIGLSAGTYIWKEIKAPNGCFESPETVDQEITITNKQQLFTFTKTNISNKVDFVKIDAKTGEPLAGATLSLWKVDSNGNASTFIEKWVTDGNPHRINRLEEGDYILYELELPEGYAYANNLICGNTQNSDLRFTLNNSMDVVNITIEDPRIKAEFEILKVDGASGDPISDDEAEFEFLEYNATTDTYEVSEHYWIESVGDGYYSVFNDLNDVDDHYVEWTPENKGKFAYRETKAPYDAEIDPNIQYFDITIDELDDSTVMSNDINHICPLHPTREFDPIDPNVHKIFLGHNAKTSASYYKDYLIFTDPDLATQYEGKVFANEVFKGGFELVKWDNDSVNSDTSNTAQGDVADLSGFEFKLYNRSGKAIYVYPDGTTSRKVKVENNGLIGIYTCDSNGNIISTATVNTLITNSSGYVGVPHNSLQAGTYEIVETKAADGYILPDNPKITFTITKDDEYFHFEYGKVTNESDITSNLKYFADDIIRGDVQLVKYDAELNKSEVIGGKDHGNNTTGAKLNNIQFEIINSSDNPVYVNNTWYDKGEVVATITTHWNNDKSAYTAETTGKLLPYGSYTIREKTAGEGYIKTNAIQNFVIREDGKLVTLNTNGELIKFNNQVIRANIQFKKIENAVNRTIKAPFLLTNLTTGEQHIVVTTNNGDYSSETSVRTHSTNTNGNDWLIEKYLADPSYSAKKSDLDDTAGTWFGLGEDGSIAPVNDTLCALPYGDYELKELLCHSNEGLTLVTVNFSVGKETTDVTNLVDLRVILNNDDNKPKIVSSAIDNGTQTHVARANQVITLVDRVTITNLVSEDNYKVVGYLIDKSTGEKIKYNNKEVTSEYEFLADGTTEICNIPFTFNTGDYIGKSVVVYLYLYKEGTLVTNDVTDKGANINNISETISIPVIHTSLADEYTKDNVLTAETIDKSKVIDTVSYENLAINIATDYAETPAEITENQTYTVKGKLYDKATNKVVATNEVTFTPTTMSGTVKVPYEFNGVNGHIYVATEELYVNGILVAEHNDLEDEAQTVYSPKVRTKAVDNTTNTQSGVIGENQIIRDTVYYENLVVGKTYTVKGTLMDKESNLPVVQNGAPITASKVFTASKANGNIELSFVVDTTLFKNRAIVVFEDLYHKDIKVYAHADINDEDQTVFYPELKTTAINDNTNDNVATAGQTTITDTVQCSNLLVGHIYTVKGTLMDKTTGEYLGKDKGLEPIVASKQFTAETKNPVIEVKFTLDGSLLQGKTCVVFEDIYHDDKLVATHGMLDDIDQTVYFPSVHTTAITDTGLKEQLALKGQLVYDYVELDNLVVGKDYTVKGKAYDKESELPIKDNGKEVTSELTFTATDTHMVIKLEFNISDASKLNGKTMVVFEKLYHNDYEVATHEDINDFEQSIKYPKIETTAFDIDTHLDEINPAETTTICDEIDFTNLEVGATYTIRGTIYRKDTNEPMKFMDGYVIGTTTFIAKTTPQIISQECVYVETLEELNTTLAGTNESTTELGETKSNEVVSGKVEVVFKDIDVKDLYGKTIVAFEYLYRDNVPIGIHADINDKNQDIKTLDISTFAREKESGIQEIICSKETNIVDTITLTNATENNTYTIISEIVDIDTDEVIARFKDDYTITNKNFVETKNGYNIYNVDINMTIDSSELGGRSFVIYEYVERNDVLLALHKDKDDLKQRLYFPYIRTTATDLETTEFDSLAEEDDMLIDTVKYENLTKGELYYVVGILMDKETKAPVIIDGKEITSTTYFYAGEDKPLDTIPTKTRTDYVNSGEKVSGTIDVTFKFNSTSLAGKDVVVFEKAYTFDNIIVGEHEDIDDKDQTISYPKIGTTLLDKSTERHEGMAKSDAVYIDTVKYENLCVGKEYTVTGTLMDKSTGKPLTGKGATSTVTFTPTKANGEVEVKFVFDSSSLAGKVIVCFEDLYRNNHLVAAHTDLEDENQSVSVTPPPGSPTKYVKVKIAKADKLRTYYMLKGAEITIFNGDGTIAKDIYGKDCVGVTDENGLVWFHLYQNPWDHYYAQETKAPKGYAICNDKFAIYATDDMSKDADNAYQINVNIFDMWLLIPPKTGDNLPILPICLMAFLFSSTFITGVILLRRKRKH